MSEAHIAHLTHKLRVVSAQVRNLEEKQYRSPAQERFLAGIKALKGRLEEAIEAEEGQVDLFPEAC